MPSECVQPPSGVSKPNFSEKHAAEMVERIFGLKVSQVKPLPSYDDQNFHIHVAASEEGSKSPVEYVLKIINCEDSQNPELLEVQTRIMMFLHAEGFPVATPHCTKDGGLMYLERTGGAAVPRAYLVRLLSFLPGQVVATIPTTPSLLFRIGQLAAKLDKTLAEKFQHPLTHSLHRGEFIWNLANVPLLEKYLHALDGGRDLEVVKQVIEQFRLTVVPQLGSFRPCINHGDFNDHNILVEVDPTSPESSQYRVSGILDFSDMSYGYYVFEAAITIMYMIIESNDPLSVGRHVLAGFESIVPLTREERGALFLLVSGRFAQSLVMAAHTAQLHPENREYLMITAKTGWKHLRTLSEMGQEAVEKVWFGAAQTEV